MSQVQLYKDTRKIPRKFPIVGYLSNNLYMGILTIFSETKSIAKFAISPIMIVLPDNQIGQISNVKEITFVNGNSVNIFTNGIPKYVGPGIITPLKAEQKMEDWFKAQLISLPGQNNLKIQINIGNIIGLINVNII